MGVVGSRGCAGKEAWERQVVGCGFREGACSRQLVGGKCRGGDRGGKCYVQGGCSFGSMREVGDKWWMYRGDHGGGGGKCMVGAVWEAMVR